MTLILAHRGAALDLAENTVSSIREAARLGADGVEVDVRTTADGALVLSHDPVIGGMEVARTALVRLRKIELPGGERVTTLEEALGVAEGMFVNLELKWPFDEEAMVEGLVDRTSGFGGPLLISSFYFPVLPLVAGAMPSVEVGVLTGAEYDPDSLHGIEQASRGGFPVVLPQDPAVSRGAVERAHSAGLRMIAWTVKGPMRIRELAAFGIDGIITDDPASARSAL